MAFKMVWITEMSHTEQVTPVNYFSDSDFAENLSSSFAVAFQFR